MTGTTPIWQEPVTTPSPDPGLLALPGVEHLRRQVADERTKLPLMRLAGIEVTDVDEGTVTCTMQATPWLAGPKGTVHPGFLSWLADMALTMSVFSAEPPGVVVTTPELSLSFLRRVHVDEGPFTATGTCLGLNGIDGLAQARLVTASGELIAFATSRLVGLPIPAPDTTSPAPAHDDEPTTDPWRRPVQGNPLSETTIAAHSGLELLQAQAEGTLPLPPIHHLTGISPVSADTGTATFSLPAGAWHQTALGTVYGGALAFLASAAVSGAAQTLAATAAACDSLDIKINLLRPVPADGRPLLGHGTVRHPGRTLVVSQAELTDADSRLVALATGSTRLE